MDLVIGEDAVGLVFPGIQHLAAQRQNGLGVLVAALLGGTAGGIALDQEQFAFFQIVRLAIGQLARQDRHAGGLAFLDLLPGALAHLRSLDGQIGYSFRRFLMLVEPQFERVAHHRSHQAQGVARRELFLGLSLKLRVQHLGREHEGNAAEHVVRRELDALGQEAVVVDETLQRIEHAVAQAGFMRPAGRGVDQVDVGLAHDRPFFRPGQHPFRALALGKDLVRSRRILGELPEQAVEQII